MITPPTDPSFSLWLALSVLGVIASGRQLLAAERRGNRLSAALDLAELLQGAA